MSLGKKSSQLIWFDSKTLANLTSLYVKSGADSNMALNEFISNIVKVVLNDEQLTKVVLEKLYMIKPELKTYSFFVEKVEVEKPTVVKTWLCPLCESEFKDKKTFKEHFSQAHLGGK